MSRVAVKKVFGFDTLRFLAIFLVVMYHCFPGFMPGGFIAVEIFFVLSGFLICQKLIREKRREGKKFGSVKGFFKFFWNRLTRFLPTLVFCMVITLTLAFFADPDILTRARPNSLYAATFTTNIASIVNGTSYESELIPNLFNQTWFLALEMQLCSLFYILIAMFYRFTSAKKMKVKKQFVVFGAICLLLGVISYILMGVYGGFFNMFDRAYFGIDSHAGAFLIGAGIASILSIKRIKTAKKMWAFRVLLFLSTAGLITMSLLIKFETGSAFFWTLFLTAMISVAMIYAILKLQRKDMPLIYEPFEYLGSLSYSIYLLHWGLLIILPAIIPTMVPEAAPYLVIFLSIVLAMLLKHVITPFSKKHKRIFAVLLALSLILPIWSLVKAPDISSIEKNLAEGAQTIEENTDTVDIPAVAVDYSGVSAMANVLSNDTMKFFDATVNFAKPYPTVIYGGGAGMTGRAYYNTPDYSRVSALASARVMVLGDSVVVGASGSIYGTIPGVFVDAKESRNMYDAINLLAGYRAANGGNLPSIIVIGLITNYCSFGYGTLQAIMDTAGPGHKFVFMTGYLRDHDRTAQNGTLMALANNYGNVRVGDWVPLAAANPGYLYADGIHLTPSGRSAYAGLVSRTISGW